VWGAIVVDDVVDDFVILQVRNWIGPCSIGVFDDND